VNLAVRLSRGCLVHSSENICNGIGDFNLAFLDLIDEVDGLKWSGNCNELNAAYSADGKSTPIAITANSRVFTRYQYNRMSCHYLWVFDMG
jgi:hypothetical protein